MKKIHVPGIGLQDCVLMRKMPEGEYDVDICEDLHSLIRDVVDDGTATLRANQQEEKQKASGSMITGSILSGAAAAHVVANPLDALLQLGTLPLPQTGSQEQADDSKFDEDKDDGDDDADDIASSLLAGFGAVVGKVVSPPAQSKTAARTAATVAKAGDHGKNFARNAGVITTIAKPQPTTSPSNAGFSTSLAEVSSAVKGRGKQSRIPLQADLLLEYEKVPPKVTEMKTLGRSLQHEDFKEQILSLAVDNRVNAVLKEGCRIAKAFMKEMKQVKNRLDTRTSTPDEAKNKVKEYIEVARIIDTAFAEFLKFPNAFAIPAAADWARVVEAFPEFVLPFALDYRTYHQENLEDSISDNRDKLRERMLVTSRRKGWSSEIILQVNENFIERRLGHMVLEVKGTTVEDKAKTEKLSEFALTVGAPDIVNETSKTDLTYCGEALTTKREVSLQRQEEALTWLKARRTDTKYAGILKTLVNGKHKQVEAVIAIGDKNLAERKKKFGRTEVFDQVAETIDVLKSVDGEWGQERADIFEKAMKMVTANFTNPAADAKTSSLLEKLLAFMTALNDTSEVLISRIMEQVQFVFITLEAGGDIKDNWSSVVDTMEWRMQSARIRHHIALDIEKSMLPKFATEDLRNTYAELVKFSESRFNLFLSLKNIGTLVIEISGKHNQAGQTDADLLEFGGLHTEMDKRLEVIGRAVLWMQDEGIKNVLDAARAFRQKYSQASLGAPRLEAHAEQVMNAMTTYIGNAKNDGFKCVAAAMYPQMEEEIHIGKQLVVYSADASDMTTKFEHVRVIILTVRQGSMIPLMTGHKEQEIFDAIGANIFPEVYDGLKDYTVEQLVDTFENCWGMAGSAPCKELKNFLEDFKKSSRSFCAFVSGDIEKVLGGHEGLLKDFDKAITVSSTAEYIKKAKAACGEAAEVIELSKSRLSRIGLKDTACPAISRCMLNIIYKLKYRYKFVPLQGEPHGKIGIRRICLNLCPRNMKIVKEFYNGLSKLQRKYVLRIEL